jgi:flagella basal body P-ring formation protein FlgA
MLATVIAAAPALAATLRPEIVVTGDLVTVGDLFEDAGAAAGTPIFRAPELGIVGSVPAAQVVAAAVGAGLADAQTGGLATVTVVRASIALGSTDYAAAIREAIAGTQLAGVAPEAIDIAITAGDPGPLHAAATAAAPLRVASLSYSVATGAFVADLAVDRGGQAPIAFRLAGTAVETVAVAVLTRPLERGELVGEADVTTARVPRRLAPAYPITDPAALVGLAAGRSLGAGEALLSADFAEPILIARNAPVTIVFQIGGLTITAGGTALDSASAGAAIRAINDQSGRTVEGIAVAPGIVRVDAGPTLL